MTVWVITGVNFGNEESCNFTEVLAVFNHEPSDLEIAIVKSDATALDPFGKGFDEYEINPFDLRGE